MIAPVRISQFMKSRGPASQFPNPEHHHTVQPINNDAMRITTMLRTGHQFWGKFLNFLKFQPMRINWKKVPALKPSASP